MDVVVSYARADAVAVRGLTDDIELGDHRVWFDRDLHGGDDWWARILERIRSCSVLVFALSQHALRSRACNAELDYAEALGVPVVPIQVGAVDSVATSRVARYQVVDGREQGSALGYRVMAALAGGTARRGPLPPEPEFPFAYLARIGRQVTAPQLRSTGQAAIIGQLRYTLRAEADDDARAGVRRLLKALRDHPECTWANVEEIDEILDGAAAPSKTSAGIYERPPSIVGAPIALPDPTCVAVSPDGARVYVTNWSAKSLSVVDVGSWTVVGSPIVVGTSPVGVAVSPDGRRVYVANHGSDAVSVVDGGSGAVVGSPIPVGRRPYGVAVSPDGQRVYVANNESGSMSVVDTGSGAVVGSPITVGKDPLEVAVSPDGRRVYVANHVSGSVSVVDVGSDHGRQEAYRGGVVPGRPPPLHRQRR